MVIARKIEKAWVSIPVSCIDIRADDLLISGMSGKPIVKRNRFIYHADGNCTVNQSLEAKARASAGCNGAYHKPQSGPDATTRTPGW